MSSNLILSIESAIEGGSVALLRDRAVVGKWNSAARQARSEEILLRISELIEGAGADKRDLTSIAVSNGPGSYTGIRVGLATAMGLAFSLSIPCIGISAFNAIALESASEQGIVLLPIGRDGCCWRSFNKGAQGGSARTGNLEEFILQNSVEKGTSTLLAHGSLVQRIVDLGWNGRLIDTGQDVAVSIGYASISNVDDGLTPFYARDNPAWQPGASR